MSYVALSQFVCMVGQIMTIRLEKLMGHAVKLYYILKLSFEGNIYLFWTYQLHLEVKNN